VLRGIVPRSFGSGWRIALFIAVNCSSCATTPDIQIATFGYTWRCQFAGPALLMLFLFVLGRIERTWAEFIGPASAFPRNPSPASRFFALR
jgi:hypothetical protein